MKSFVWWEDVCSLYFSPMLLCCGSLLFHLSTFSYPFIFSLLPVSSLPPLPLCVPFLSTSSCTIQLSFSPRAFFNVLLPLDGGSHRRVGCKNKKKLFEACLAAPLVKSEFWRMTASCRLVFSMFQVWKPLSLLLWRYHCRGTDSTSTQTFQQYLSYWLPWIYENGF